MFKMQQSGFIDAVLSKKYEWGTIYIAKRVSPWYTWPRIEYDRGEISRMPPVIYHHNLLEKKIQEVSARNWGAYMTYFIKGLESEVEKECLETSS